MILNFYGHLSLAGPETAKGSPFLPDELAFSLRKKKKKEKWGKRFKSKAFIVAFCWQTTDIQWEISMQKKKRNVNSSSKIHLLLK